MRNVLLSILFIILPTLAHAQEVIVSYDKSSLSVLNEELRSSASGLKTLRGQVADLLPVDLSDSSKVTGVLPVANGGTGTTSLTDIGLPSQTGNSGKFLTTNGSVASWGSVTSISQYTSSTDYAFLSATTERRVQDLSYTKKKECLVERGGTISVSFSLCALDGNEAHRTYGRIYVNGVAVGTERSTVSGTYTTWTETITVAQGDLVQLYCYKYSTPSSPSGVKDFILKRAYTERVVLD